jgi:hypothetical protein
MAEFLITITIISAVGIGVCFWLISNLNKGYTEITSELTDVKIAEIAAHIFRGLDQSEKQEIYFEELQGDDLLTVEGTVELEHETTTGGSDDYGNVETLTYPIKAYSDIKLMLVSPEGKETELNSDKLARYIENNLVCI